MLESWFITQRPARLLLSLVLVFTMLLAGASAFAQRQLPGSGSSGGASAPASSCVRMTQDGEWVSDPVLSHPLIPFLNSTKAAWLSFGATFLLFYLLAFALFQSKLRNGGQPLSSFGASLVVCVLLTGIAGYFLTGHLSYAENWCVDRTAVESQAGVAPSLGNAEVEERFGVGINEIATRGAIPIKAHLKLTPWYFWLGGAVLLALVFFFAFRSRGGGSAAAASTASSPSSSSDVDVW